MKKEDKYKEEYDPYLSGAVVTVVIKKENTIYFANVGNVLAFLFYSERTYYKFKVKELTVDNSAFKAETGSVAPVSTTKIAQISIPNNIIEGIFND
jgi:hypothetical protein